MSSSENFDPEILDESLYALEIPERVINTLESYYTLDDDYVYIRHNRRRVTELAGPRDGSIDPTLTAVDLPTEDEAHVLYTEQVTGLLNKGFRNVLRVRDLLSLNRSEILRIPNFGEKTLETIMKKLKKKGMPIQGQEPELTAEELQALRRSAQKRDALGF